ncbi:family 2 glycosyl transferase [Flavobacterium magnum]|uniref:Family 2 glycosyl transferase n=1 Tax=Flavobacterium magnum TaxID=2162713 RepID=A0A2S0REX6_9FLAO|nr:glycosyltransferase [Flavobacterium magnum]AWA29788.1 family 2 glycosyl transferase [Flavobacterium magnum]
MSNLKQYITKKGEVLLYNGTPDLAQLEILADGPGDIWHSSFEQGYKNAFPELVYQTAIFFWYINDFDGLDECVSWRVNPNAFAVRQSVWEILGGFDPDFESVQAGALDFGFRAIRFYGGVPLYVKGLFSEQVRESATLSRTDRHVFFRKNFKTDHAIFMIYRMGILNPREWHAFLSAKRNYSQRNYDTIIPPRLLKEVSGTPTVSYIIPTMFRQDFTLQLLDDLAAQSHPPAQVIVVDATPESERDESLYAQKHYPFRLEVVWQQSKGSCRARNEAILLCSGDYIVFGDDDIRVPADFIENHLRFLQTYGADACNGLDIRADHHQQGLEDLRRKLSVFGPLRWRAGVTTNFSNANSCVRTKYVHALVGNDINFDGGYGEDGDFGLSLAKLGLVVMFNPFSTNLHLKPPSGGYRWWGAQAKILGKKRKTQPWELDTPVGLVRPVPSPTVMYGIIKQFTPQQLVEYKHKHFSYYLFSGPKYSFVYRLLRIPYKNIQFHKSVYYAKKLIKLGVRTK